MEITNYKLDPFKILFYEKDTTDYALIVKPPYKENHPYQKYEHNSFIIEHTLKLID